MSDSKRATLITVGAPKCAKKNVTKTVRLTINLDESNESKYPELNYKELVIAEERRKQKTENGKKPQGLDPFSENDEDVARVARKFEQKYGGKSTYGRKSSKHDEFADIGAGYDESDSFIDNTDGYDEMIPPECDTLYGGFYINCGSLEFKTVPDNRLPNSDSEAPSNRRNKRRISSSSSEDESSDSSSESESQDEKEKPSVVNGDIDSHKTEHRKKKNKKSEKKKAKRICRNDSSAATSGKQTSDDNAHADGESADSRTSQSDSLTSKPAPSSENAITSDSSRDAVDAKLPSQVVRLLDDLSACVTRLKQANPNATAKDLENGTDTFVLNLERALQSVSNSEARAARTKAAKALDTTRSKLATRVTALAMKLATTPSQPQPAPAHQNPPTTTNNRQEAKSSKKDEDLDDLDPRKMKPEQVEAKMVETLKRLKALIEDRKPSMMLNYNAECERVQEQRKKIQIAQSEGAPHVEKRLPKRRFPWCQRTRTLLARVTRLAGSDENAARVLATRVLPLFPSGFVRIPTLLRQSNLKKELGVNIKPSEIKRQRSVPAATPSSFNEPIHFPSSLTVTTTIKTSPDKPQDTNAIDDTKQKYTNSVIKNANLSKDPQFVVYNSYNQKDEKRTKEEVNERTTPSVIIERTSEKTTAEKYLPPNSIGSITITPVPNNHKSDQKTKLHDSKKEPAIRVKSQATLIKEADELAKTKYKKPDKKPNEKRVDSPLHIDTSQPKESKRPEVSPKDEKPHVTQKQLDTMRVNENNIPRPTLVPVHHSPTFAKPDKRPPDTKKTKKDVVIIQETDPLGDAPQELLSVDDSSSDVELIEDSKSNESKKSPTFAPQKHNNDNPDVVPSRDKNDSNHKKADINQVKPYKPKSERIKEFKEMSEIKRNDKMEVDETEADIHKVMQNLREMQNSQDTFSNNPFGGVITSAKRMKQSSNNVDIFREPRNDKDKLTNFFEQNGWM